MENKKIELKRTLKSVFHRRVNMDTKYTDYESFTTPQNAGYIKQLAKKNPSKFKPIEKPK